MTRIIIPAWEKRKTLYMLFSLFSLCVCNTHAQNLSGKLQNAFLLFEKDSQLAHAVSSLYVIDAENGRSVFEKNAQTGLAPASTQKVITSISALAMLGIDFRFTTSFAIDNKNEILYIIPSGDPTLGSERWENTKAEKVLHIIQQKIKRISTNIKTIRIIKTAWASGSVPDGWIWQDIGNYYGAGSGFINWRENQYDLFLQSGSRIGDSVHIVGTQPKLFAYSLKSEVIAASRGTGDNAYIYFNLADSNGIIRGSIPVNENAFAISGAFPSGARQFCSELSEYLVNTGLAESPPEIVITADSPPENISIVHTEISPGLDSIIYWFNKKSINLYGEALLKSIAFAQKGNRSTDTGIVAIQEFWKRLGIDPTELNLADGSGLSPVNRVTTHAQVQILQFAQKQSWFPAFFNSLPVYNGITMKSGTIRNVKGYTGYHTGADGKTYIFSFLVNNYNGSPSALVRKMYNVLDVLK